MKFVLSLVIVFVQLNLFGQNFTPINVKKLGAQVNLESTEEIIPVVSKELGKLFFVRSIISDKNELTTQNIFESNIDGAFNFSNSSEFNALNNKGNNGILSVNSDGTRIYLLDAYSKELTAGIAVSNYQGGKWSKPERLEIPNLVAPNTLFGFHVSKDETVIIMAYNDVKGLGEEDLFVSTKSNGKWSSPMHMGNQVNSTGYEISPFLSPSKDTLFFSSNGFNGLGDADIYYAVKGNAWNDWTRPVNLGAPINSEKFDAYFTYSGDRIYWASNRNQKFSDIYTATMNPISPLDLDITSVNCSKYNVNDGKSALNITGGVSPYSIKWMDGSTEVNRMNLKPGEYSVVVTDMTGNERKKTIIITQPKEEIPEISFVHYFDYNGYAISEDQKLKDLISNLNKLSSGSPISIKIVSSASTVPTAKYASNEKLAEKRAKELLDLILKSTNNKNINIKTESIVGGPAYNQDATDAAKYKQHQYVKIVVL